MTIIVRLASITLSSDASPRPFLISLIADRETMAQLESDLSEIKFADGDKETNWGGQTR